MRFPNKKSNVGSGTCFFAPDSLNVADLHCFGALHLSIVQLYILPLLRTPALLNVTAQISLSRAVATTSSKPSLERGATFFWLHLYYYANFAKENLILSLRLICHLLWSLYHWHLSLFVLHFRDPEHFFQMPSALEPVALGHSGEKKQSEEAGHTEQLSQVSTNQHICVPKIFPCVTIATVGIWGKVDFDPRTFFSGMLTFQFC